MKGSTVHHQQHLQQQHQQQQLYYYQQQQQPTISMATIEYMTAHQAAKSMKSVKITEGGERSASREEHSANREARSFPPSAVVEAEEDGDRSVGDASMSTLTSLPTVISSATYL